MDFASGAIFCMANPATAKDTANNRTGSQVRRKTPDTQWDWPATRILL